MNELEIKKVPFLGAELMAARDADGQIWAGVRWMCEGIGLSEGQSKSERLKIQKDKVLSKGGRNFVLPTKGGNQDVLCLKLDFVPLWLAKISITPTMEAETPELAATLEQYQIKAKDVLAAAFLPKKTHRENAQASKSPGLSAVNGAMKITIDAMKAAGVAPEYIALTVRDTYKPYGISIPDGCLPESEKLYECEAIAKELGVYSERGNPHKQAVSAIISLVGTLGGETRTVPFTQGGYSSTTVKYTQSVLERVRDWLAANCYPAEIQGANGKIFRVSYRL